MNIEQEWLCAHMGTYYVGVMLSEVVGCDVEVVGCDSPVQRCGTRDQPA